VDGFYGLLLVLLLNHDGHVDLRGSLSHHLDGDAVVSEAGKELGGKADLVGHTLSNARDDGTVSPDLGDGELLEILEKVLDGTLGGGLVQGDGDLGDGAGDNVRLDLVAVQALKQLLEELGSVQNAISDKVENRDVLLGANGHYSVLAGAGLEDLRVDADGALGVSGGGIRDDGSVGVGLEGVENLDGDVALDGASHGEGVENFVSESGQLGSLRGSDQPDQRGVLDLGGVSSEDSVRLLPHLEGTRSNGSSDQGGGQIRVSTTDSVDDAALDVAEESGHDREGALVNHGLDERLERLASLLLVSTLVGVEVLKEQAGQVDIARIEALVLQDGGEQASREALTAADDEVVRTRGELSDNTEGVAELADSSKLLLDELAGLLPTVPALQDAVEGVHVGVLNAVQKDLKVLLVDGCVGRGEEARGRSLGLGLGGERRDDGDDRLLSGLVELPDDAGDLLQLLRRAQ